MSPEELFKVRGIEEPTRKPRPSAATQIGRFDWLGVMPYNPHAFRTPELQQEYAQGYSREVRDMKDAKNG